jgi:hypothetical protein
MTPCEGEPPIGLLTAIVADARARAGELESVTVRRRGIAYTLDLARCRAALGLREDRGEPPWAGAGARPTPCAPPSGTGSAALRLAFEDA